MIAHRSLHEEFPALRFGFVMLLLLLLLLLLLIACADAALFWRRWWLMLCHLPQLAKGQMLGGVDGFLKLLFDTETLKLLGVHAFGEGATEIIHIGQVSGEIPFASLREDLASVCCSFQLSSQILSVVVFFVLYGGNAGRGSGLRVVIPRDASGRSHHHNNLCASEICCVTFVPFGRRRTPETCPLYAAAERELEM